MLQWQAKYEGIYLLGTSIARPLISKVCLQVAREVGADAYAHGATGKGNDQCRFQLAAEALDPAVRVIAPWRIEKFRASFPGRKEMIAYCSSKKIPVKASAAKPYSSDENCLHISYEAGKLEDLSINGVELVDFGMTVSPQQAPDKSRNASRSASSRACPSRVNGRPLSAFEMVRELNAIGGRNGIGRIDMVENRFVGMKSRGVYEAPGMTLLYAAHRAGRAVDAGPRPDAPPRPAGAGSGRDGLLRLLVSRQDGRPDGLHPPGPAAGHRRGEAESLQGQHHGRRRESPNSLYDEGIASMEGGGSYNQTDAEGFLRIQGLPLRVQGRVTPREY